MMPETDGIALCERVKANPKHAHIPIILLTAMTGPSTHINGFKAGADDYLTKPFQPDVLEARIDSLLLKNRKVEEYIKQKLIMENQEVEVESYSEKLLQETIRHITSRISDPEINIEELCKAIGVSHSNLYRKIKAQTGLTINELIRQIKLKKAAQLIRTKKLTIAEIMDETGFTNHSYFAKCFKNEYGLSPREYAEKTT
jgi:YesN/AraC family two-component response regulator